MISCDNCLSIYFSKKIQLCNYYEHILLSGTQLYYRQWKTLELLTIGVQTLYSRRSVFGPEQSVCDCASISSTLVFPVLGQSGCFFLRLPDTAGQDGKTCRQTVIDAVSQIFLFCNLKNLVFRKYFFLTDIQASQNVT